MFDLCAFFCVSCSQRLDQSVILVRSFVELVRQSLAGQYGSVTVMTTPNKIMRLTVRWSEPQWEKLQQEAAKADQTPSEFVRRCALGQQVIAVSDQETANELRRIGRMLKGLYPKDAHWPALEKAKYWATMNKLFSTADKIGSRHTKKGRSVAEGSDAG